MVYCKKCGAKIDEDAEYCQKCGAKQVEISSKEPEKKKNRWWLWVLMFGWALGMLLYFTIVPTYVLLVLHNEWGFLDMFPSFLISFIISGVLFVVLRKRFELWQNLLISSTIFIVLNTLILFMMPYLTYL